MAAGVGGSLLLWIHDIQAVSRALRDRYRFFYLFLICTLAIPSGYREGANAYHWDSNRNWLAKQVFFSHTENLGLMKIKLSRCQIICNFQYYRAFTCIISLDKSCMIHHE